METSSPNRIDTPRGLSGVWAGENAIEERESEEEEEEEEDEDHGGAEQTMDVEENDEVRYGAPATEDEPEPHEPEEAGPDDPESLVPYARRMRRLLEWHQNLLDVAQSRGDFEDVERIERDIDHIEGLLMELPQP